MLGLDMPAMFTLDKGLPAVEPPPTTRILAGESRLETITSTPGRMAAYIATIGKMEIGRRIPAVDGNPRADLKLACRASSRRVPQASNGLKISAVRWEEPAWEEDAGDDLNRSLGCMHSLGHGFTALRPFYFRSFSSPDLTEFTVFFRNSAADSHPQSMAANVCCFSRELV